jgi:hypothetical protein
MTPPRICPPQRDCPLYAERLPYGEDEPLRRAILMERRGGLTALVRAEALTSAPPPVALPQASELPTLPVFDSQKGVSQ